MSDGPGTVARCPCGAAWVRTYHGDRLVHIACARGHEPVDWLRHEVIAHPFVRTDLTPYVEPHSPLAMPGEARHPTTGPLPGDPGHPWSR